MSVCSNVHVHICVYSTRLKEAGGCTIWNDEMDMLSQIERRLDNLSIPRLDRKNLAAARATVSAAAAKHRSTG
jgi:hypothetical protein